MSNSLEDDSYLINVIESLEFCDEFESCSRTYATFCLYSKALSVDDILEKVPLDFDRVVNKNLEKRIQANAMFISSRDKVESKDVSRHIVFVVNKMISYRSAFKSLQTKGCYLKISCYWESKSGNGGPVLRNSLLKLLGELGLDLDFDIWF